jgi:hypothetical protein
MRFKDFKHFKTFLKEEADPQVLAGMKAVIASKIKELPPDDATVKALREIEDLLRDVGAGGAKGIINKQLQSIDDNAVLAAQKLLARYILSMDVEPDERNKFFSIWREDKIVNIGKLLSKERQTFADIFNGYTSNKAVEEFVNDVMEISELGMGRGEFGLNVLSKSIWAPEDNKGDLKMKLNGKVMQIECKTSMGGAARFSDQEVRPAEGYEQAAIDLNNFVKKNKTYPMSISGYGLNLNQAIEFYQNIKPAERTEFIKLVKNVVTKIFGDLKTERSEDRAALAKNVSDIIKAISVGDDGAAKQAWSRASFNYYMSKKDDDGVLYIDLVNKEFVFYSEASDLENAGLRLHAKTIYLSTVKDPGRGVYPQIEVVQMSYGANAAVKNVPKMTKGISAAEFNDKTFKWAKKLANRRNVTDPSTIRNMTTMTVELLAAKVPTELIIAELENQFPELQIKKKEPDATKVAPEPTTPAPTPSPTTAAPAVAPAVAPAPTVPATMQQPAV